tara:strand:- start:404 stop:586 length:183 start_codon:yes stop_codon:yes gene_type:complete
MSIDFYYALLVGWILLGVFWSIILLFIFIRKPPKHKLTLRILIVSLIVFVLGFVIIHLLR